MKKMVREGCCKRRNTHTHFSASLADSYPAQPSPGSGEIVAFVLVKEAALEESKSALCFCVPLPNMSPTVH